MTAAEQLQVLYRLGLQGKDYFDQREAEHFTLTDRKEFRALCAGTGLRSFEFMGKQIFRKVDVEAAARLWQAGARDEYLAELEAAARRAGAPTCLYRHFDGDGRLLYVGISISAAARTSQHSATADWFRDVRSITLEWHPNRAAAFVAELQAIRCERPLHNTMGQTP